MLQWHVHATERGRMRRAVIHSDVEIGDGRRVAHRAVGDHPDRAEPQRPQREHIAERSGVGLATGLHDQHLFRCEALDRSTLRVLAACKLRVEVFAHRHVAKVCAYPSIRWPGLIGFNPLRKVERMPLRCSWLVNVAVDTELSCARSSSVRRTGRGGSSDDIDLVKHGEPAGSQATVASSSRRLGSRSSPGRPRPARPRTGPSPCHRRRR